MLTLAKQRQVYSASIYIFGINSLTQRKKEVWLGGTQPMLLPEWSCIFIPSFRSLAPMVFLAKIPFLVFFHYHGNHFAKFLVHVLTWVNTYHHAGFKINQLTGLARMMGQTYRETDRQADRQTDRQTDRHLKCVSACAIACVSGNCWFRWNLAWMFLWH